MGHPIKDISEFEQEVNRLFSISPAKWLPIFLVNANSDDKNVVDYILNNFETMDVVSKDVDFYLPGYYNNQNHAINPHISQIKTIIDRLATCTSMDEKDLSALNMLVRDIYPEYKGDPIRIIKSRRLGNIVFNDAEFADFVFELQSNNKKYSYSGHCELIIMPVVNGKPKYDSFWVTHLNKIAYSSGISLESFIFYIFNMIRDYTRGYFSYHDLTVFSDENHYFIQHSIASSYACFNKEAKNKMRLLLKQYVQLREAEMKKAIPQDVFDKRLSLFYRHYYDYLKLPVEIAKLYNEATKELPENEEDTAERVASIIKDHLHWSLDDDFYFISYSSKDSMKAMHFKNILENYNKKVWIAPDGIPTGSDYGLILPHVIRKTRHFVLMLSENAARSEWVRKEIERAINQSKTTTIQIVFVDGYNIEKMKQDLRVDFLLSNVQAKYTFEDLIYNDACVQEFIS